MKSVHLRRITIGFLAFSGCLAFPYPSCGSLLPSGDVGSESMRGIEQHIELPEFAKQPTAPDLGQRVLATIKSANAGDAEAQYLTGLCCLIGFGMKKDAVEAGQWFQKAAGQGLIKAKYQLGYMAIFSPEIQHNLPAGARLLRESAEGRDVYAHSAMGFVLEQGLGVPVDQAKGVEWYKKAAAQGVAEAQYNLGHCYTHGEGIAKDESEGTRLYRLAAEQGYIAAEHNLGLSYIFGRGITQDQREGARWVMKAAESGTGRAQATVAAIYMLGLGVEKSDREGCVWMEKAANNGFLPAQRSLARAYQSGKEGVAQDFAACFKWATLAADQGDTEAMARLAYLYYESKGVPQDYASSLAWYRKAADKGQAFSQYTVGEMLYRGLGALQNKQESAVWIARAARSGCDPARLFLAARKSGQDMEALWETPEQKEKKAIAAAASGDPQKQFELGCLYYNGVGRPKDLVKAHEWVVKAAAQNHARALMVLPKL